MKWFGHVQRRLTRYVCRQMLKMELCRRQRGRPKKRFVDVVTEDMKKISVRREDAGNRRRMEEDDFLQRFFKKT